MSIQVSIEVTGIPRPGGSKTIGRGKGGKLFLRDAGKHTATWRSDVKSAAAEQYQGSLMSGAISMSYDFRFPRPKHHFRKNGELKPDAPLLHTIKPDLTKIIRSTEDALTGVVWKDDSLVASREEVKRYCQPGERPGVTMLISEIQY